jgi:hypothetical protein
MHAQTTVQPNKDVIHAYKEFACQIIIATFQVLELWAQSHHNYNREQMEEIGAQLPFIEELEVYHTYCFFYEDPQSQGPSGLAALVRGLELELDVAKLKKRAIPQLRKAFSQVNQYRALNRLPPIQFPKLS